MDLLTHALFSFALARAFFPRRPWSTILAILLSGTLADIDLLSAFFGPAAYFAARRTFTHSIIGTLAIIAIATLFARYLDKIRPESLAALLPPITIAALLHVLLDLLQSEGVAALWPFSPKRYAAGLLPSNDFWILAVLLAGILLPELFRLITSEIGAKDKHPRGRTGAILALAAIALYIVTRALLHTAAAAALEPHSYKGESPRRVAAYPDSFSLLTWHGVVDTTSFLCQVAIPSAPNQSLDAESATCVPKPQPSPQLDAAQNTPLARAYILSVPFPRASVTKTQDGYEILIRSLRDAAEHQSHHRLAARILVTSDNKISSQQLIWLTEATAH